MRGTPRFFVTVEEFKKRPYDLLEYQRSQFDRDHLEFNVNIHDLETTLQGFINGSFENITSTDHALNLLRQFQAILQRDTLKADVDDKCDELEHHEHEGVEAHRQDVQPRRARAH